MNVFPSRKELGTWMRMGPGFLKSVVQQHTGRGDYKTIDEAVDEVLEETGAERVNLFGHSFGGLLAMEYALDTPGKVEDIITVASAYAGTKGIHWSQTMRLFSVYNSVLYDMLFPDGSYIQRLHRKFERQGDMLAQRPSWVTNFVSLKDEFVKPEEMMLGQYLPDSVPLNEIHIPAGHCQIIFDELVGEHLDIMMMNGSPTIGVHPIYYQEGIFTPLKRRMHPMQANRFYTFNYDYLKMPEERIPDGDDL